MTFLTTLKELVDGVNAARAKKDASATMLACAALGGWCADASEDIVALVEAAQEIDIWFTRARPLSHPQAERAEWFEWWQSRAKAITDLRDALSRLEAKP
jgi:predicted NUDIX family NTP pyrophosphohydrolase